MMVEGELNHEFSGTEGANHNMFGKPFDVHEAITGGPGFNPAIHRKRTVTINTNDEEIIDYNITKISQITPKHAKGHHEAEGAYELGFELDNKSIQA